MSFAVGVLRPTASVYKSGTLGLRKGQTGWRTPSGDLCGQFNGSKVGLRPHGSEMWMRGESTVHLRCPLINWWRVGKHHVNAAPREPLETKFAKSEWGDFVV